MTSQLARLLLVSLLVVLVVVSPFSSGSVGAADDVALKLSPPRIWNSDTACPTGSADDSCAKGPVLQLTNGEGEIQPQWLTLHRVFRSNQAGAGTDEREGVGMTAVHDWLDTVFLLPYAKLKHVMGEDENRSKKDRVESRLVLEGTKPLNKLQVRRGVNPGVYQIEVKYREPQLGKGQGPVLQRRFSFEVSGASKHFRCFGPLTGEQVSFVPQPILPKLQSFPPKPYEETAWGLPQIPTGTGNRAAPGAAAAPQPALSVGVEYVFELDVRPPPPNAGSGGDTIVVPYVLLKLVDESRIPAADTHPLRFRSMPRPTMLRREGTEEHLQQQPEPSSYLRHHHRYRYRDNALYMHPSASDERQFIYGEYTIRIPFSGLFAVTVQFVNVSINSTGNDIGAGSILREMVVGLFLASKGPLPDAVHPSVFPPVRTLSGSTSSGGPSAAGTAEGSPQKAWHLFFALRIPRAIVEEEEELKLKRINTLLEGHQYRVQPPSPEHGPPCGAGQHLHPLNQHNGLSAAAGEHWSLGDHSLGVLVTKDFEAYFEAKEVLLDRRSTSKSNAGTAAASAAGGSREEEQEDPLHWPSLTNTELVLVQSKEPIALKESELKRMTSPDRPQPALEVCYKASPHSTWALVALLPVNGIASVRLMDGGTEAESQGPTADASAYWPFQSVPFRVIISGARLRGGEELVAVRAGKMKEGSGTTNTTNASFVPLTTLTSNKVPRIPADGTFQLLQLLQSPAAGNINLYQRDTTKRTADEYYQHVPPLTIVAGGAPVDTDISREEPFSTLFVRGVEYVSTSPREPNLQLGTQYDCSSSKRTRTRSSNDRSRSSASEKEKGKVEEVSAGECTLPLWLRMATPVEGEEKDGRSGESAAAALPKEDAVVASLFIGDTQGEPALAVSLPLKQHNGTEQYYPLLEEFREPFQLAILKATRKTKTHQQEQEPKSLSLPPSIRVSFALRHHYRQYREQQALSQVDVPLSATNSDSAPRLAVHFPLQVHPMYEAPSLAVPRWLRRLDTASLDGYSRAINNQDQEDTTGRRGGTSSAAEEVPQKLLHFASGVRRTLLVVGYGLSEHDALRVVCPAGRRLRRSKKKIAGTGRGHTAIVELARDTNSKRFNLSASHQDPLPSATVGGTGTGGIGMSMDKGSPLTGLTFSLSISDNCPFVAQLQYGVFSPTGNGSMNMIVWQEESSFRDTGIATVTKRKGELRTANPDSTTRAMSLGLGGYDLLTRMVEYTTLDDDTEVTQQQGTDSVILSSRSSVPPCAAVPSVLARSSGGKAGIKDNGDQFLRQELVYNPIPAGGTGGGTIANALVVALYGLEGKLCGSRHGKSGQDGGDGEYAELGEVFIEGIVEPSSWRSLNWPTRRIPTAPRASPRSAVTGIPLFPPIQRGVPFSLTFHYLTQKENRKPEDFELRAQPFDNRESADEFVKRGEDRASWFTLCQAATKLVREESHQSSTIDANSATAERSRRLFVLHFGSCRMSSELESWLAKEGTEARGLITQLRLMLVLKRFNVDLEPSQQQPIVFQRLPSSDVTIFIVPPSIKASSTSSFPIEDPTSASIGSAVLAGSMFRATVKWVDAPLLPTGKAKAKGNPELRTFFSRSPQCDEGAVSGTSLVPQREPGSTSVQWSASTPEQRVPYLFYRHVNGTGTATTNTQHEIELLTPSELHLCAWLIAPVRQVVPQGQHLPSDAPPQVGLVFPLQSYQLVGFAHEWKKSVDELSKSIALGEEAPQKEPPVKDIGMISVMVVGPFSDSALRKHWIGFPRSSRTAHNSGSRERSRSSSSPQLVCSASNVLRFRIGNSSEAYQRWPLRVKPHPSSVLGNGGAWSEKRSSSIVGAALQLQVAVYEGVHDVRVFDLCYGVQTTRPTANQKKDSDRFQGRGIMWSLSRHPVAHFDSLVTSQYEPPETPNGPMFSPHVPYLLSQRIIKTAFLSQAIDPSKARAFFYLWPLEDSTPSAGTSTDPGRPFPKVDLARFPCKATAALGSGATKNGGIVYPVRLYSLAEGKSAEHRAEGRLENEGTSLGNDALILGEVVSDLPGLGLFCFSRTGDLSKEASFSKHLVNVIGVSKAEHDTVLRTVRFSGRQLDVAPPVRAHVSCAKGGSCMEGEPMLYSSDESLPSRIVQNSSSTVDPLLPQSPSVVLQYKPLKRNVRQCTVCFVYRQHLPLLPAATRISTTGSRRGPKTKQEEADLAFSTIQKTATVESRIRFLSFAATHTVRFLYFARSTALRANLTAALTADGWLKGHRTVKETLQEDFTLFAVPFTAAQEKEWKDTKRSPDVCDTIDPTVHHSLQRAPEAFLKKITVQQTEKTVNRLKSYGVVLDCKTDLETPVWVFPAQSPGQYAICVASQRWKISSRTTDTSRRRSGSRQTQEFVGVYGGKLTVGGPSIVPPMTLLRREEKKKKGTTTVAGTPGLVFKLCVSHLLRVPLYDATGYAASGGTLVPSIRVVLLPAALMELQQQKKSTGKSQKKTKSSISIPTAEAVCRNVFWEGSKKQSTHSAVVHDVSIVKPSTPASSTMAHQAEMTLNVTFYHPGRYIVCHRLPPSRPTLKTQSDMAIFERSEFMEALLTPYNVLPTEATTAVYQEQGIVSALSAYGVNNRSATVDSSTDKEAVLYLEVRLSQHATKPMGTQYDADWEGEKAAAVLSFSASELCGLKNASWFLSNTNTDGTTTQVPLTTRLEGGTLRVAVPYRTSATDVAALCSKEKNIKSKCQIEAKPKQKVGTIAFESFAYQGTGTGGLPSPSPAPRTVKANTEPEKPVTQQEQLHSTKNIEEEDELAPPPHGPPTAAAEAPIHTDSVEETRQHFAQTQGLRTVYTRVGNMDETETARGVKRFWDMLAALTGLVFALGLCVLLPLSIVVAVFRTAAFKGKKGKSRFTGAQALLQELGASPSTGSVGMTVEAGGGGAVVMDDRAPPVGFNTVESLSPCATVGGQGGGSGGGFGVTMATYQGRSYLCLTAFKTLQGMHSSLLVSPSSAVQRDGKKSTSTGGKDPSTQGAAPSSSCSTASSSTALPPQAPPTTADVCAHSEPQSAEEQNMGDCIARPRYIVQGALFPTLVLFELHDRQDTLLGWLSSRLQQPAIPTPPTAVFQVFAGTLKALANAEQQYKTQGAQWLVSSIQQQFVPSAFWISTNDTADVGVQFCPVWQLFHHRDAGSGEDEASAVRVLSIEEALQGGGKKKKQKGKCKSKPKEVPGQLAQQQRRGSETPTMSTPRPSVAAPSTEEGGTVVPVAENLPVHPTVGLGALVIALLATLAPDQCSAELQYNTLTAGEREDDPGKSMEEEEEEDDKTTLTAARRRARLLPGVVNKFLCPLARGGEGHSTMTPNGILEAMFPPPVGTAAEQRPGVEGDVEDEDRENAPSRIERLLGPEGHAVARALLNYFCTSLAHRAAPSSVQSLLEEWKLLHAEA